jgi:prolyl-tRNA synthetase
MKAVFLDEQGEEHFIIMGCYGIGVSRIVAASIEQRHDRDGIIFPIPLAPFEVIILPLQMHESRVVEVADRLHQGLEEKGVDVLIDDRDTRAGGKFKDADLLGIPLRVTLGDRGLKKNQVEIKERSNPEIKMVPVQDALTVITNRIRELYDSLK